MTTDPVSVLHIVGLIAERYGGPPRNVRDVCAALAARGHRVVVLATDRDGPQRLSEADRSSLGSEHRWVIVPVPTRGPALSRDFVRRMQELLVDADVAHLHGIYSPATAVAGIIAHRTGVPYVQQLHGAATEYHWRRKRWKKAPYEALIQRRVIAHAAAVVAMTEKEAEEGLRVFPSARMQIVPPPVVDESAELPGTTLEEVATKRESITVGFLGRLSEKKGAPILLSAFSQIAEELPQARLVVAGPDDEGIGARMRREVDRLGLKERVSFPGMVVGAEKAAVIASFDLFALPSADESFGIAVVEAMNAGLPVMITEHVAIAEDVRSAGAGLIASRDEAGFASALRRLLRDPAEAARMGAAGRALAVERFSREASTADMERLYRAVIA